jgi:heat shock 70kDa protein 1/2/6/8
MASIRSFVKNMTGLEPREGLVDPDAAVATGAAIFAGVLSGHIQNLMVMDVWQAALLRALAERELKSNADVREAVLGSEELGPGEPFTDSDSDDASETVDCSGATPVEIGN